MPQPANSTSQSYYLESTMDYFRDYIETIDSTGCSNMVQGMILPELRTMSSKSIKS